MGTIMNVNKDSEGGICGLFQGTIPELAFKN
jgi:hypothetical protein